MFQNDESVWKKLTLKALKILLVKALLKVSQNYHLTNLTNYFMKLLVS
jgi:hypothetical protein